MTYLQKLEASIRSSRSVLCVGLDPNLDLMPAPLTDSIADPAERVSVFCRKVIDCTSDYCAAFKPNLAFFEALGADGLSVLDEVIRHIPEGKIIVADAKRGDISSTAEHYNKAYFERFNADALTINPLMGFETLDAFSHNEEKGLYVLALTSNTGAADFLKKPFDGFDSMGQYIANQLYKRSRLSDAHLGMVIGATQASEAEPVLRHHRQASLLIPGIGAQGGSIEELRLALNDHEGLPLINSSRGIIYAGKDEANWEDLVKQQAEETQNKLKPLTDLYV